MIKKRRRIITVHKNLGHVRNIECTGSASNSVVLCEVAAIANRHIPATKVGEACSKFDVLVVQNCFSHFSFLLWLLLSDAVNASTAGENWSSVDQDNFSVRVATLENCFCLSVIFVVKCAQNNAAIDYVVIDV